MAIKYISWNYGSIRGEYLHLIRFTDGSGKLYTTAQMIKMGLARGK